jgi:hypothetical protein
VAQGGFPAENSDGTTPLTNVPLLAQSDGTAFGIINSAGRPAFAINIDSPGGTNTARGIVQFYDRYDGAWHNDIALKSGNVGIGTASPGYKLEVGGTAGFGQSYFENSDLYFTNTNHNHSGIGNTAGYAAIENAANYNTLMILGRSNGIGGARSVSVWDRLDVNGQLYVMGTLIAGSSRTMKDNIRPLGTEEAMAAFSALRPTSFTYKTSPNEGQLGFIAEEVPAVVATKDRKGVYTMNVVALLTKVVQSQQEQLKSQEKTVKQQQEHLMRLQDENTALLDRLVRLETTIGKLAAVAEQRQRAGRAPRARQR